MKRVNDKNINDSDYWDQIYINERDSGKERIDNERLHFLVDAMREWSSNNQHEQQPTFLDVGCGDGELLRKVHALMPHWSLAGVDITPQTIAWASTIDPKFNYQVGSIYEIPHPANNFNVVFCGETLEHLDDPQLAVDSLFSKVKDGGILVCSFPCNHNNYSEEHLNEFTVMDAIKLTTKGDVTKLIDIDVKCGGLSTIWTTAKR